MLGCGSGISASRIFTNRRCPVQALATRTGVFHGHRIACFFPRAVHPPFALDHARAPDDRPHRLPLDGVAVHRPERRFIDVPTPAGFDEARRLNAIADDIPGAPISHEGDLCSFDTLNHAMLAAALPWYDALDAWCQWEQGESHSRTLAAMRGELQ